MDFIVQQGCAICRSPAEVHHLLRGGRRMDHLHTIPLCPNHHRSGINCAEYVSRHPWKREFEKRYGTEWELWEQVKRLTAD
jgi:hypothetical protein